MGSAPARAVEDAVGACLDFILRHQSPEGSWTDWNLPPGPSSYWSTAYIGGKLASIPDRLGSSAAPAAGAAAQWLLDGEYEGGGWGYNDNVGCDADSTAHAILFLSDQRVAVPKTSYRRLLEFQRPDGGFSTYPADEGLGSWGVSHPDVSAVASRALFTNGDTEHAALERALDYVLSRRNPQGTWNSFWWSSPLYATQMVLSLLGAVNAPVDLAGTRQTLESTAAGNAFERALLLDSLLRARGGVHSCRVDALVDHLVAEQLPDGSWRSAPVLRVTHRECASPWERTDAGSLYADPRRLFTSTTVLSALCRFADGEQR